MHAPQPHRARRVPCVGCSTKLKGSKDRHCGSICMKFKTRLRLQDMWIEAKTIKQGVASRGPEGHWPPLRQSGGDAG